MNKLVVCVLLLSILVACSKQAGEEVAFPFGDQSKKQELTLATGGVAGTYYTLGAAIAFSLTEKLGDIVVTPQSTGASIANLTLLSNGDVDLIMAASNSTQRAYEGSEPFTQPNPRLRAIASLYPEAFHFIVKQNLHIRSLRQLRGMRVSVGSNHGGTAKSAQEIIEAHGIDFENDIKVENLSFSEAVFALEADHIDVAVVAAGIPTDIVEQIADIMEIRLLEVDEQMAKEFVEKQPYMFPYIIPGNTYKGIPDDVLVLSSPAMLVTTSDQDEQLVYRITEALFSEPQRLADEHEQGAAIRLDSALQGISIPLHPGARRYYQEKGLIEESNDGS